MGGNINKRRILEILGSDTVDFVSGEDLSDSLGLSRAGVWKHVEALRKDGYEIKAISRRGYKLISSPDKLLTDEILRGLKTTVIGKKMYYFPSVGSTNNVAYDLAEKGEGDGTVVFAETQTNGKGRVGRKWISSPGGGIYMSVILKPGIGPGEISTITLVAAVAMVKAIEKAVGIRTEIKWPNDIMANGKKVSGILAEIKSQPDRIEFLILGIGVNVNTSANNLPSEATSLKEEYGVKIDRKRLARYILSEIECYYLRFSSGGFPGIRDECRKMSLVLGKKVRVEEYRGFVEGVAVDIGEDGELVIKAENGDIKRILSGDVVLCREI